MGFFRNPEIRRLTAAMLCVAAALSLCGLLVSPAVGAACAFSCVVMGALALCYTKRRYRDIAVLCARIDDALHGADSVADDGTEGELAILRSSIAKMTVALRRQTEALQADKVFLSDSLSDISHQLKTPLTAMNLVVTLLRKPDLSEERRFALSRELATSLNRMEWQVSALLKLSRLDASAVVFRPEAFPVCELLRRAAEPLAVVLELRELRFCPEATDVQLVCDPAWTIEALGNILKNCAEHTPPGGAIGARCTENAVCVTLTIYDDGTGIDGADLSHIFERFYRGKADNPSAVGIGLALTNTIVRAQNGTVCAANRPEGGALFTLRFYKCVI